MTEKLACPKCQHFESKVVNCRPDASNEAFRRWRVCQACGRRFLTEERIVQTLTPTQKYSTRVNM